MSVLLAAPGKGEAAAGEWPSITRSRVLKALPAASLLRSEVRGTLFCREAPREAGPDRLREEINFT